jgi:hypothetical protein
MVLKQLNKEGKHWLLYNTLKKIYGEIIASSDEQAQSKTKSLQGLMNM